MQNIWLGANVSFSDDVTWKPGHQNPKIGQRFIPKLTENLYTVKEISNFKTGLDTPTSGPCTFYRKCNESIFIIKSGTWTKMKYK